MKKYSKYFLPIFLISLITLLLFLVGCVPSAPTIPVSTKATIEGRIMVPGSSTKDISGWVPLPNAVITLTDSEGKIHTVTTDSDGYYTLFDIPPGINYIITATGKVGENTVVLKDIIPKVETGKNYDAGTADSESTALSLVVEALLVKGLAPEEIDLEEIQNTDNFSELVSLVTSVLEENGDVTTDPVIENQVEEIEEEIVSPETPEPEPEPEPSPGGGGGAPPITHPTFTITSTAGANGSIGPSGAIIVDYGSSQSFTITADAGYYINNVLVDESSVGAVSSYTFTNVTTNHTIAAIFAIKDTHTITASAGANGSISPSGAIIVDYGLSQSFTITADVGYYINNVLVDESSVGAVSSYTFTNVTANHTIAAIFAITPSSSGSISGIVISDAGGPAVEDSTITVVGTTLNTTTDAQGNYALNVPIGTYDVIVTQSGRATSKAQSITIIEDQITSVDFIQKEVNVPEWETDPPTISTTGIVEGATLSGTVTCSVQVADDSDIKCIYVGFGYIPSELEYDFASYDSNEITPDPIDTTTVPDGGFQIVIVAYDMNYNRSQLTLNVTINNEGSGDIPITPTSLWPLSITLGEKIGFFSEGRDELFKRIGIKEDPNIINLPEGRKVDLNAVIDVADPDSNLFVGIDWDSVVEATGYKIYRKFEGEDIYYCIGSTEYTWFYDTDPQLSVGRKTYYQVSAYNGFGESEKTSAEWTIPLPKFNLNLVSPQNGATGVSLNPTLQWQPVEIVGKYQEYYFYVMGKNDSYYTWGGGVRNETSVVYDGEPLQYLKVYEWNVDDAIAIDDFYDTFPGYRALSIAGTGTGSLNGAFEFTTKSESE